MKIILIMVAMLAFCLMASADPVAVGGDFGRTWLSNYLAQNPRPTFQDTNNTLTSWGGTPKSLERFFARAGHEVVIQLSPQRAEAEDARINLYPFR